MRSSRSRADANRARAAVTWAYPALTSKAGETFPEPPQQVKAAAADASIARRRKPILSLCATSARRYQKTDAETTRRFLDTVYTPHR